MEAKQYFKAHPARVEVFQTEDGYLFHQENDAKNHARSLDNKVVKRIQNSNVVTSKATETVAVVETVIGSDEGGNIVEKAISTKEVEKIATDVKPETPVQVPDIDKTLDVPVIDGGGVKVTPEDTNTETKITGEAAKAEVKAAKAPAKKAAAKKQK